MLLLGAKAHDGAARILCSSTVEANANAGSTWIRFDVTLDRSQTQRQPKKRILLDLNNLKFCMKFDSFLRVRSFANPNTRVM